MSVEDNLIDLLTGSFKSHSHLLMPILGIKRENVTIEVVQQKGFKNRVEKNLNFKYFVAIKGHLIGDEVKLKLPQLDMIANHGCQLSILYKTNHNIIIGTNT